VVVDQLEQLFLWSREHADSTNSEVSSFAETIAALSRSGVAWTIATLRSDLLTDLEESATLSRLAADERLYRLERPTRAELRDIVLRPASVAHLQLEGCDPSGLPFSEVLIEAASAAPDSLPLLQFVLARMFDQEGVSGRLTYASYDRLGGLEGAIELWADETIASLGDSQQIQQAVDRVIIDLGRLDREKGAIVSRAMLLSNDAANNDAAADRQQTINALAKARLVVLDETGHQRTARVAHEALLSHWPRAIKLFERHAFDVALRDELERDAARWSEQKDPTFLLASGRPLDRASELLGQENVKISDLAARFVQASLARDRNRRLRWILGAAAMCGALISFAGWAEFSREELLRNHAAMLSEFAETYAAQGDTLREEMAAGRSLDVVKRLAESDKDNNGLQRDLSDSFERMGDVQMARVMDERGHLSQALESYQASFAIRQRLADSDKSNTEWQRDLSASYDRIGDVLYAQGHLSEALDKYQASLTIRQRLTNGHNGNAEWQRDLAVSHNRIGDVEATQGRLPEALENYQSSLEIRRRLTDSDTSNAGWQSDLAWSYAKIGDVMVARGHWPEALQNYQLSLNIRQRLADSDSNNSRLQSDVASVQMKLEDVAKHLSDTQSAR
jgi:tetratricopeptide (TPR) repeat protein